MLAELDTLFDANESQAKSLAAIYQTLVGGVPNIAGFTFLINANNLANYGAGPGPVFNDENIYINIANALVQDNAVAKAAFDAMSVGATLKDQVESIYKTLIPFANQTAEGLAYIIRPEGLAFYAAVALERGITTANGAAIIAMASILKIAVDEDIGVGDAVNDLIGAVKNDTAVLPDVGDIVTPIEDADGTFYDYDDVGSGGNFELTPGKDGLVGSVSDDTFVAGIVANNSGVFGTLGPLDSIDGGAGNDTLSVEVTGGLNVLTGTIKNIENVTFLGAAADGAPGVNGDASIDGTLFSGTIKLQQTSDVSVNVTGVTGQTIVMDRVAHSTVFDTDSNAAATSISLESIGPLGNATFVVDGAGLSDVLLKTSDAKDGFFVIVENNNGVTNSNTVKNVTIESTGQVNVGIVDTALETVTIKSTGMLTLYQSSPALKSIDASASTGGVTVASLLNVAAKFTGGSGADRVGIAATTAAHIMGDGDDTVFVFGSALGAGGSVDAGQGTADTLQMSSADAAAASANGTFEGAISNFEKVSLTQTAVGATDTINLANLDNISNFSTAGTDVATITTVAAQEVQTIVISAGADADGGILKVGGVDIQIAANATATDIRDAIVAKQATIVAADATIEGVVAGVGDSVFVIYRATAGDVPPITISHNAAGVSVGVVSEIIAGNGSIGEVQNFSLGAADADGGELVIGGVKVAVPGGFTVDQVAAAIIANQAAIRAANTNIDTIGYSAIGSLVTITYKASAGNVANIVAIDNLQSSPLLPTSVETTKGALFLGTAAGALNVTNMANNGTLEITGAINGASSVVMANATSGADTLNIKLNGTANIINTAQTTVAGVEVIKIEATDSTLDGDPSDISIIMLNATAAKTIMVTGNHGVNFNGSALGAVTALDASGVTGTGNVGRIYFAAVATTGVELKGGAGNDIFFGASRAFKTDLLEGNGGDDALFGGAGSDTISGGSGDDAIVGYAGADILSGGTGNDNFIYVAVTDSVLASRDIISDFSANTIGNGAGGAAGTGSAPIGQTNGDTISFSVGAAQVGVGSVVGVVASANSAQAFIQSLAGNGTANQVGIALDNATGLLYIDGNSDGVVDSVIELTGVTTIDAAAVLLF